jgi:hypoxia up-regulated 1
MLALHNSKYLQANIQQRVVRMRFVTLLISLFALVNASRAAGVLAIDYGTEFMKVSLLKPGLPFDVLLNT